MDARIVDSEEPAFEVVAASGAPTPLVFASPHSGDRYPGDMDMRADLPLLSLRSAEDALVDRLVAAGPDHGAPLIRGRVGRAYVDLNRSPDDLDPLLFEDAAALPPPGPKVAAGYGVLPRLTGDGLPLYDRRLTLAEAHRRLTRVHHPYHYALARQMQAAHARHGRAILIDWHSMPSRAAGGPRGPDVVLGDRHGASCGAALSRRLRALFESLGLKTALNRPYAGGYSTQLWGRPDEGYEAIQIELSRALYLDEATLAPADAFERRRASLTRLITALCADFAG